MIIAVLWKNGSRCTKIKINLEELDMSVRAKNKYCRTCKFRICKFRAFAIGVTSDSYANHNTCKLTGQPIKHRNKRCGCISLYRMNINR